REEARRRREEAVRLREESEQLSDDPDKAGELLAQAEEIERSAENVRIDVRIYRHAAIPLLSVVPEGVEVTSIDLQMYRISEYKDRRIKRVMRIMKQCAIGCQIHYRRNVRDTDVDGSAACDYDVCRYPCV